MEFKLLECTLRDGGYQVNWDFSEIFVSDYLDLCSNLDIKNIELGFRFFDNNVWRGKFAYTTEEVISKLNISNDVNLGVMLFSGQAETNNKFDKNKLDYLFPLKQSESRVDFVRIATYIDGLSTSYEVAKQLISQGYEVSINLMQIQNADQKTIEDFGSSGKELNLKSIYFADSVGCLFPKDVKNIVGMMKSSFGGEVGIHAHNNLGLAFINSVSAIEAGATWVDGTLTGIGRGPGNTLTEDIYINYFTNKGNNYQDLISFNSKHLEELKYSKKWGSNPYYFLAGKNKIHPSYIQEMLHDESFNEDDIVNFIESTSFIDKESFDIKNVNFTEKIFNSTPSSNQINSTKFKNSNILILGSGGNLKNYSDEIETFITKFKPLVIQLNANQSFSTDLIDYNIFLNPNKLASEIKVHKKRLSKVISPSQIIIDGYDLNYEIIDVKVGENFATNTHYLEIPNSLVLGYAFMVAVYSDHNNIYMAGFDGYKFSDQKNDEVNLLIEKFRNSFPDKNLISITPSFFNLNQKSVVGLLREDNI